jgi:hypothetical protein
MVILKNNSNSSISNANITVKPSIISSKPTEAMQFCSFLINKPGQTRLQQARP